MNSKAVNLHKEGTLSQAEQKTTAFGSYFSGCNIRKCFADVVRKKLPLRIILVSAQPRTERLNLFFIGGIGSADTTSGSIANILKNTDKKPFFISKADEIATLSCLTFLSRKLSGSKKVRKI